MAKIFDFFSSGSNKKDKGYTKEELKEDKNFGTRYFFKLFRLNFGRLTSTNLIFSIFMIPAVFNFISFAGTPDGSLPTPQNALYPQIFGIAQYEPSSPVVQALSGVFGISTKIAVRGVWSNVLMYAGLLLFLTYGAANVGMTYILRGMVRRQYVYLWHDFMQAIKRNFKQALVMGALDLAVMALLAYDLLVYRANDVNFIYNLFFYLILLFTILYFMMRFYIYLIMITFDLSLIKIIKNALIFSLLGIKRNLMAIIGIFVVAFVNFTLYYLVPSVGILMPFIWTFSFSSFISAYCAYPIIKRYMIDPHYGEDGGEAEEAEETERVFTDRG